MKKNKFLIGNYNKKFKFSNLFIILLTSYLSESAFAQGAPTFVQTNYNPNPLNINKLYVSPEVAQLMKVDFIPTNLYTGRLNLDLPLFEIESGDIKIPISLKYNSTGIKVEEEASNVGLGWSLQAGGNITNMIRDIDDNERTIKSLYSYSVSNGLPIAYPTGSLQVALGNLKKTEDINIPYDLNYLTTDALPDLFFCSAPGLLSKFTFERNDNNISIKDIENPANKIVSLGYTNFGQDLNQYNNLIWLGINRIFPKIYSNNTNLSNLVNTYFTSNNYAKLKNISNDYEAFTINNSLGIQYKFATYDINISCAQLMNTDIPLADTNAMQRSLTDYIEETYKIRKSTWHLDEIKDTNNNKVTFEYQKFTNSDVYKYLDYASYKVENVTIPQLSSQNETNYPLMAAYTSSTNPDQERSLHVLNAVNNYISKIKWVNGELDFKYDYSRLDANNKFALSEIILKDANGNFIKKYVFNYSYFQSGQTSQSAPSYFTKRLKLTSIDFVGRNNEIIPNWYTFSYENNKELPSRNSREVDYLGYFNNNGIDSLSDQSLSSTMPKLYFIGGRYHQSITPFSVNNSQEFAGNISLNANDYSLAGLLTSFKNPTGAINEFVYEPNQFDFYGQTIIGGGVRIKKQTIKENNNSIKEYTYEYLDEQGKTSGSINNVPKFADLVKTKDVNNKPLFIKYLRSKGNVELTDGSYVGYSRIIQKESGKGYTELKYSSPLNFANLYPTTSNLIDIPKNSSFPGDIFIDQDVKRGKLLENKIFDNLNNLVSKEVYNYEEKIYSEKTRQFKKVNITSFLVASTGVSGIVYNFTLPIKENNYLLSSKNVESYFQNKKVSSTTNYFYENPNRNFLTKEITIHPDNTESKKIYQYPENLRHGNQPQQNISPYQFLPEMIQENILEVPLVTSHYYNNIFKERSQIIYEKDINTNLILPKKQLSYSEDITTILPGYSFPFAILPNVSDGFTEVIYDKFDDKGNIQQYTNKNGLSVTIIWGYNNTLPIAKIEGAKLSDISQSLINIIVSSSDNDAFAAPGSDETIFLSDLNIFRSDGSLAGYQITTYTYDPLVGVRSITPPSGIREVYIYDNANRLKEVREQNQTGKLLKEFQYNYKH